MKGIQILLVEDNEGDIVLTLEALSEGKLKNQVSVVRDGAEALDYLYERKNTPALLPDLILLDINLPKIDGKEVLQTIKNDNDLKTIPVVMLTTSSSDRDVKEAYDNHANCFITKPVDLNKFFEVVKVIEDFWISIVKLPLKE
jgi:two-component system, chemotaxis family, response regulator Rcp1